MSTIKKADSKAYQRHRKQNLMRKYQLTSEDYSHLLTEQNGRCAICYSLPKRGTKLVVDHDHTTGEVRGLLCSNCNTAIGLLQDSLLIISKASDYLEKWK